MDLKTSAAPLWIFSESKEYSHIDVLDEFILFCRREQPSVLGLTRFDVLPECLALYDTQDFVKYLRLLIRFQMLHALVGCPNKVMLLKFVECHDSGSSANTFILSLTLENIDRPLHLLHLNKCASVFVAAHKSHVDIQETNAELPSSKYHASQSLTWDPSSLGRHSTKIMNLEFLPMDCNLLGSFSAESCKLWNISTLQLIRSLLYSNFSFGSVSLHPSNFSFLYGTQDGKLVSVNYSDGLLMPTNLLDLSEHCNKSTIKPVCQFASETPVAKDEKRNEWSLAQPILPKVSNEESNHVLATCYFPSLTETSTLRCSKFRLAVIVSTCICIFDLMAMRLEALWNWSELGLPQWPYAVSAQITVGPSSLNFWVRGPSEDTVFFTMAYRIDIPSKPDCDKMISELSYLSLVASGDIAPNSVLRKVMRRTLNQGQNNPKKNHVDKPLTFGHPIKSSGYAKAEPRRKLFVPLTNAQSKTRIRKSANTNIGPLKKVYTSGINPPNVLKLSIRMDSGDCSIYQTSYSPTGRRLAISLASGICVLMQPLPSDEAKSTATNVHPKTETLRGHKGPILCASWSSDGELLVTSSTDRTARIWKIGKVSPTIHKPESRTALVIDSVYGGSTNCHGETTTIRGTTSKNLPANPGFQEPILCAHFHYMDAFIYLACRNVVHLFSYDLFTVTNKLDKGNATSVYKAVGEFEIPAGNRLTAVASANIFYSYFIWTAGSSRSLCLLDLNRGAVIQQVKEAHNRTITSIALNQGSLYCSPTQYDEVNNSNFTHTSYSTFATVAPGDCVHLWDMRDTSGPVMRFQTPGLESVTSHSGAPTDPFIPSVKATFSPCGLYLLVGGRMNQSQPHPMIYDVRRPDASPMILNPNVSRVQMPPATAVTWNPVKPEVATGGYDGRLSFFVAP